MTNVYTPEVFFVFFATFAILFAYGFYCKQIIVEITAITGFIAMLVACVAELHNGYENGIVILGTISVGVLCIYFKEKGIYFTQA